MKPRFFDEARQHYHIALLALSTASPAKSRIVDLFNALDGINKAEENLRKEFASTGFTVNNRLLMALLQMARGETCRRIAVRHKIGYHSYSYFAEADAQGEFARGELIQMASDPYLTPAQREKLEVAIAHAELLISAAALARYVRGRRRNFADFASENTFSEGRLALERAYATLAPYRTLESSPTLTHIALLGEAAAKLSGAENETEVWQDRVRDELQWAEEANPLLALPLGVLAVKHNVQMYLPGGPETIIQNGYFATPQELEAVLMSDKDRN